MWVGMEGYIHILQGCSTAYACKIKLKFKELIQLGQMKQVCISKLDQNMFP